MGLKENIKQKRTELGLTLEDVATYLGVSKQTIYKYENGIVSQVPYEKVEAMAKLFGVHPAELVGWEGVDYIKRILGGTPAEEKEITELIDKYAKLSWDDKALALQLIRKMVKEDN